MEDIRKVLQQNKVKLLSSSDDYDSESDYHSLSSHQSTNCNESREIKCLKPKATRRKRNGEERLPTRKPDPNVYNRNALLARENRRKKKIYLETIEKELCEVRKANRTLARALRMQLEIGDRLEKEKQYYENLVKSGFNKLVPVNSLVSHRNQESEINSLISQTNEKNDVFKCTTDFNESRSNTFKEADVMGIDTSSDDLYENPESSLSITPTTWDDIWGDKDYNDNNIISTNLEIFQNSSNIQSLNVDHCYARYSSDFECEPSDFIDVEGISSSGSLCVNSGIYPTLRTPPSQLFNTDAT